MFIVGEIVVSWIPKLQKVIALSTTKAEYVVMTLAMIEASKEMIWFQRIMDESGKKQENCSLHSDS